MMECEAYGPELPGRCFFEQSRRCDTAQECTERMTAERTQVFNRLQELATTGDPLWEYLAGEFTSPDQLLNARETDT